MPGAEMPEDFLAVIRSHTDRPRHRGNFWLRLCWSWVVTATRRVRPKITVGTLACVALGVLLAMSIVGD